MRAKVVRSRAVKRLPVASVAYALASLRHTSAGSAHVRVALIEFSANKAGQFITFVLTTVDTYVMIPVMSKLIAYYRVSTKQQGASGLGLDAQKTAVDAYAA